MGQNPGNIEKNQLAMLRSLARLTMDRVERRREDLELRARVAEHKLQASDERFRSVLENIPDVVVLYGPDLRIRYINAATTRITGMQPDEFIGTRDSDLFPSESHRPVIELLERTRDTRRSQAAEIDLELPYTGLRHLQITCLPVLDDQDELREILGITRDRTEQREMEKRLLQSQRLESIGQFTGDVAHVFDTI